MVKPQLNLDKKEELKKPDGNLVKVVTIAEEPAPLNPEPVYAPPTPRRSGRACKCLCLTLTLIFMFLMIFMCLGVFFRWSRGPRYGWCGVGYNDGWDYDYVYPPDYFLGSYNNYEYDSSWFQGRPYGDDMLFPPKPTGPPIHRILEEHVDVDLELRIIRINRLGDGVFPEATVMHDFKYNLTAYAIPSSDVCYIQPLNRESTLNPENFHSLLESEAFQYQDFPMRSELYTVDPVMVNGYRSYQIEEFCSGLDPYYINSIPSDQWPTFWKTAREVLRDHFRSSSEEGRGRPGGRRGPHGGRGRHGDRDSSSSSSERHSDSSSSEEHGRRFRRFNRLKEHFDNVRSFDGQEVVDVHVFQLHTLEDLSPENLQKVNDLVGEKGVEDFLP